MKGSPVRVRASAWLWSVDSVDPHRSHRLRGRELAAGLGLVCVVALVIAAVASPAASGASSVRRISAHDGHLWAGTKPFWAFGFNWGVGDRLLLLDYFDSP